jgi:hypothetical protein
MASSMFRSKIFWIVSLGVLAALLVIPSFSRQRGGWVTIIDRESTVPAGVECTMAIRERQYGIPMAAVRWYARNGCSARDLQAGFGLLIDAGLAYGIGAIAYASAKKRSLGTM